MVVLDEMDCVILEELCCDVCILMMVIVEVVYVLWVGVYVRIKWFMDVGVIMGYIVCMDFVLFGYYVSVYVIFVIE